jgi:hypothetical protein
MELYSPIGLKPIDDVTGGAPIGWVRSLLDVSDGAGGWRKGDIDAVMTPSGVITFPGLERRTDASGPPRKYRLRVEAEVYLPLYRATQDAIEFDAYPYNDASPPQNLAQIRASQPQDLILTPMPHYQFPGHVPVLRGQVEDSSGAAVRDAVVTLGMSERVLTDARGTFALPLRWVAPNTQASIDAVDQRTGRTGTITIQFPQDLRTSQTITVA